MLSTLDSSRVAAFLADPKEAEDWLSSLGLRNLKNAHACLRSIAGTSMTLDLVTVICQQLEQHLHAASDTDRALNNFERFVLASRSPLALGSLLERDTDALPILLQMFSASQHLSDVMVRDPESYDILRLTEGNPISAEVLAREICSEVEQLDDEALVMSSLRRYKHRETLRIAYGDFVRQQRVSIITRQISYVADAICEAALQFAWRQVEQRRGTPRRSDGSPAQFVVLALGKLGGAELNYSSDIDLIFLYDVDGKCDGGRCSNQEFFERLAKRFIKILSESTDLGVCYRVDMNLRPHGKRGPLVMSCDDALQYYEVMGRTWERQAFIKARPMAGFVDLGQDFLDKLEPWIYRRYLTRADINGIKALKRRIEQQTKKEGEDQRNVKTGHGGIRDIEFVIQFLQLLNGAEIPETRTGNTLDAIAALESAGCLTLKESSILADNYCFLRRVEHRLQIMYDLQTHTLPDCDEEMRRVAIRMRYQDGPHRNPLEAFLADFENATNLNRQILDHLLHNAFDEDQPAEPEVDLVLHPDPPAEDIENILRRYGFKDIRGAYENLMGLTSETVPFLSTRRCRMFLAAIAPRLLKAIADTPEPDATLINLTRVSDSLGGKGVLWELFSFKPQMLALYVRLCASSPYLAGLLTQNPGMIDELLDSLVLDRLPGYRWLDEMLNELSRGAEDIAPILHSFKNSQHLRVGVRDILGKGDIADTHRALADIAETCLKQIVSWEYNRLIERYGEPIIGEGPRAGETCGLVILALGKLGGCEPNYHSDLDIIFLFEASGQTRHKQEEKSTSNQHFFSQLAQRLIKLADHLEPHGLLFEIDPRLRPTGQNGPLAVSLPEFSRYFQSGSGQLWERQALCKARPVYGPKTLCDETMRRVNHILQNPAWRPEFAAEIRRMRLEMQKTASENNLKRGYGGTVDVEFIVQMLQMKHANEPGATRPTGTLKAIDALTEAGRLSESDGAALSVSYRFLRSIEARLRLMNTSARHDLPADADSLKKLAFLLGDRTPDQIIEAVKYHTTDNRKRFNRLFDEASS